MNLRIKNTNDLKKHEVKQSSAIDSKVFAPEVPSPPKKPPIPLNVHELSDEILEKINQIDSEDTKAVLVNCERCKNTIVIPVPKKKVLEFNSKEILVTYIHKNIDNEDKHCITFELDSNFHVQLPRVADVIISLDTPSITVKKKKSSEIKFVLIHCKRCNSVIHVPVPTNLIQNSKLPKIPIAFVHENLEGKDQHAIIIFLDKNYGDRDTRLSDLLIF